MSSSTCRPGARAKILSWKKNQHEPLYQTGKRFTSLLNSFIFDSCAKSTAKNPPSVLSKEYL